MHPTGIYDFPTVEFPPPAGLRTQHNTLERPWSLRFDYVGVENVKPKADKKIWIGEIWKLQQQQFKTICKH